MEMSLLSECKQSSSLTFLALFNLFLISFGRWVSSARIFLSSFLPLLQRVRNQDQSVITNIAEQEEEEDQYDYLFREDAETVIVGHGFYPQQGLFTRDRGYTTTRLRVLRILGRGGEDSSRFPLQLFVDHNFELREDTQVEAFGRHTAQFLAESSSHCHAWLTRRAIVLRHGFDKLAFYKARVIRRSTNYDWLDPLSGPLLIPPSKSVYPYEAPISVQTVMRSLGLSPDQESDDLKERYSSKEMSSLFEEKEASLEEVKQAFDVFDENRDGFIDATELQRVLTILGFKEGSHLENCSVMIRSLDGNKDGRIDFNGFVKFMESSFC
ncbi:probable calcium-binding protein CML45 [Raphanus sativus]|uniref:Probable calcium-binding protein CML45 n=1 Tax=Raphanus sativus TaxID=3726 RepID=A0A9W3DJ87_RAPSA|nr:probable calcium-binding protein CML45 [Raphanus sativus]